MMHASYVEYALLYFCTRAHICFFQSVFSKGLMNRNLKGHYLASRMYVRFVHNRRMTHVSLSTTIVHMIVQQSCTLSAHVYIE